jgi:hypothetical protein
VDRGGRRPGSSGSARARGRSPSTTDPGRRDEEKPMGEGNSLPFARMISALGRAVATAGGVHCGEARGVAANDSERTRELKIMASQSASISRMSGPFSPGILA